MSRAERLNDRFKLVQQSIAEIHGKELAFAAASAAWLMAIQHGAKSSMKQLQRMAGENGKQQTEWHLISDQDIERFDAEHELMLRGFHKELCSFLGVLPADAERLARSFWQVIDDICNQGG